MKKLILGLSLALAFTLLPSIAGAVDNTAPLSPRNGSTNYNAHTTFLQWKKVPGKTYELQIKANATTFADSDKVTFSEPGINYIFAEDLRTGAITDGLKNNGSTYYWRTRVNESGSTWSSIYKFSTIGGLDKAINLAPNKKNEVLPIVIASKPQTFSWKLPAGTVASRIYVSPYGQDETGNYRCLVEDEWNDENSRIEIPVTGNSFSSALLAKIYQGKYCWSVKSFNNGEGTSLSDPAFFEFRGQQVVPEPLFVQTGYNRALFYWTKSPYSNIAVAVKVATTANMAGAASVQVENKNYVSLNSGLIYDLIKNNKNKDLFWQIGHSGQWSKVVKFRSDFLGQPTIILPTSGTTGLATTTTFKWQGGAGTNKFYEIVFKKGDNEKTYYTSSPSFKPAATDTFFQAGSYTWTVKAHSDNQTSDLSATSTFIQR